MKVSPLLAALLVPVLTAADARLWGTWHGDDPDEPGSTVTLTFRDDGTYMLAGNLGAGEADLFDDLFGEPLRDTEMTPEDLAALGFQVPHITGASLGGIYSVWGDSLSLSLRQILIHVEGEEPVDATRFMLNILQNMPPDAFERLCQRLLRESGFIEVEVMGRSGDGGIDGYGIIRLAGMISFPVLFQCKRYV